MRTAAKRDTTEAEIVQALRKLGLYVVRISSPGGPDLLVKHTHDGAWVWMALEVKTKTGKQTEEQRAANYTVVRSVEDALRLFGVHG